MPARVQAKNEEIIRTVTSSEPLQMGQATVGKEGLFDFGGRSAGARNKTFGDLSHSSIPDLTRLIQEAVKQSIKKASQALTNRYRGIGVRMRGNSTGGMINWTVSRAFNWAILNAPHARAYLPEPPCTRSTWA